MLEVGREVIWLRRRVAWCNIGAGGRRRFRRLRIRVVVEPDGGRVTARRTWNIGRVVGEHVCSVNELDGSRYQVAGDGSPGAVGPGQIAPFGEVTAEPQAAGRQGARERHDGAGRCRLRENARRKWGAAW
jgi:hypothetical protein